MFQWSPPRSSSSGGDDFHDANGLGRFRRCRDVALISEYRVGNPAPNVLVGCPAGIISALMESGVEFVAADMPTANKLTIHIIAGMAEYERDVISQREPLAPTLSETGRN